MMNIIINIYCYYIY